MLSTSLPKSLLFKHSFNPEETAQVRTKLLDWFNVNKRDSPWRQSWPLKSNEDENQRCYEVWVSEIMLQQTQVATVVNYYNKWMKRWPTVDSLAQASLEEVHEMWSGLGYYSRGTRLLEGARKIVKELKGYFPRTSEELMKNIPGVGRYTAAAISSIVFGEHTGVVDGNVVRVLSRLHCIGGDSTNPKVIGHIWDLANSLADNELPGDLNQAMMELGATVCTPKTPSCNSCPVKSFCSAFRKITIDKRESEAKLTQENQVAFPPIEDLCNIKDCVLCLPAGILWDKSLGVMNFPRKPKKKDVREELVAVIIFYQSDKNNILSYFMNQRPLSGLLAGLWEFPSVILPIEISQKNKDSLINKTLKEKFNIDSKLCTEKKSIGQVLHKFSHIHQTYVIESRKYTSNRNDIIKCQGVRWVTRQELLNSAVSTAVKKIFNLFEEVMAGQINIKKTYKRKPQPSSGGDNKKQKTLNSFFKKSNSKEQQ